MGLLHYIKTKVFRFSDKFDEYLTFEDKLYNAKRQLAKERKSFIRDAELVHQNYKEANDAVTVSQLNIDITKKKLDEAIKSKDKKVAATAESLFNRLETLNSAHATYVETFNRVAKQKEVADRKVSTIDFNTQTIKSNLDNLKVIKKAHNLSKKLNCISISDDSKNSLAEIEDFIKNERWKIESEQEVESLLTNTESDLEAINISEESQHERFEAYKKKLLGK